MAQSDNIADIAFASAYPTDKIVDVYEGSFTPSTATTDGGYLKRYDIAHPYKRPLFAKMVWSTNETIWNDGGSTNQSGHVIPYTDSSEVHVITDRTTGTIYYKIAVFWIDDFDDTNPAVNVSINDKSDVFFDSRLNYQKIYSQGKVTHAAGSSDSNVITHDLGYRPNVRVYIESLPGELWQAHFGGASNPFLYDFDMVEADIEVGTTNITIASYGGVGTPASDIYYIIYYDENA